jgi:hypothetical protein
MKSGLDIRDSNFVVAGYGGIGVYWRDGRRELPFLGSREHLVVWFLGFRPLYFLFLFILATYAAFTSPAVS